VSETLTSKSEAADGENNENSTGLGRQNRVVDELIVSFTHDRAKCVSFFQVSRQLAERSCWRTSS
jgi:hypothetical protein